MRDSLQFLQCGRWFVSSNVHTNARIQCFPADYCALARCLFTSTVSGFSVMPNWCTCQSHNWGRTEHVGKQDTICNDQIHPQDVSAEQVHDRARAAERLTERTTYSSKGGWRGRPWRRRGRRGWHLPLSTLLYLHWTPHPGGWIKHTHA